MKSWQLWSGELNIWRLGWVKLHFLFIFIKENQKLCSSNCSEHFLKPVGCRCKANLKSWFKGIKKVCISQISAFCSNLCILFPLLSIQVTKGETLTWESPDLVLNLPKLHIQENHPSNSHHMSSSSNQHWTNCRKHSRCLH